LITLLKRMLVLLLLPSVLTLKQGGTTPTGPTDSFEGIEDPDAQCIDILCYEPIMWSVDTEDVCRFRKDKECMKKNETVCIDAPVIECEAVGYTDCKWKKKPVSVRNDTVVGELFDGKECVNKTKTVWEKKLMPWCVNETKIKCEEKWIPHPPFWVEVNCEPMTWENCNLKWQHVPITHDYCDCWPIDIWYNKLEKKDSQCVEEKTSCVPHAALHCTTKYVPKNTTVCWEECWETCKKDCSEMHFREPSQKVDHRRWCSPHEIVVHPDPHHDPHHYPHTSHTPHTPHPHAHPGVDHSPRGDEELTDKQSTDKVTNSNIVSNQRSKKGNSFSNSKAVTTSSNQRSNSQKTPNPDSLSSPLVFSRPATSSNRRSSVPQNFQDKRTIRQGQRIRA